VIEIEMANNKAQKSKVKGQKSKIKDQISNRVLNNSSFPI
jgi:hypothetical protein